MLKNREDLIIKVISESFSISDVCKTLGLLITNGNYISIRKIIKEYNLDISHFKRNKKINENTKKINIQDILVENSSYGSSKLKKRLISEKIKEEVCECCNNSEWLGDKIPLQLHHKNGISTDTVKK